MEGKPANWLSTLLKAVGRKKAFKDERQSAFARVLTLVDLTGLGVGSTLGLGGYVLAGVEAKNHAGPAVVISFVIAAVAAFLAGLCYAEFAARVPKAGSVYIYSYVAVGELVAFIMGWNYILGCIVSTATLSRAIEGYIDSLLDHRIERFQREHFTHGIPHLAEYIDVFALVIVVILTALLSTGVKDSAIIIGILTTLNLLTISTAVIAGATVANPSYWHIPKSEIPANMTSVAGEGGFLPFGVQGVMVGAANCFFGYIGFDCVAAATEEAKKPKRDIPVSIIVTLVIVLISYIGTSIVLTMMRPYYEQDLSAPFPAAFDDFGMNTVKWIVTIGTLCALGTNLFASLFPLPRIMWSMARDGLMFKVFESVNTKTQTPLIGTLISGALSGITVLFFDLTQLISMMSITCFLSFIVVSVSVMVLMVKETLEERHSSDVTANDYGLCEVSRLLVNSRGQKRPCRSTSIIAKFLIALFVLMSVATSQYIVRLRGSLYNGTGGNSVLIASFLGGTLVVILFFLCRQPTSDNSTLSFAMPMGPLIPCLSLYVNTHLMAELDFFTWVKFLAWGTLGIVFYFTYSIRHSTERPEVAETKTSLVLQQR